MSTAKHGCNADTQGFGFCPVDRLLGFVGLAKTGGVEQHVLGFAPGEIGEKVRPGTGFKGVQSIAINAGVANKGLFNGLPAHTFYRVAP